MKKAEIQLTELMLLGDQQCLLNRQRVWNHFLENGWMILDIGQQLINQ